MTRVLSPQSDFPRFQFSLWMLLLIVPAIAGFVFAVISLTWHRALKIEQTKKEIAQLQQEVALAGFEYSAVHNQIALVDENLEKHRRPQSIVAQTKTDLYSGGLSNSQWDVNYFAHQVRNEDVRLLVTLLKKEVAHASEAQKLQIIDYLKRILVVMPERKVIYAAEAEALLASLSNDSTRIVALRAEQAREMYQSAISSEMN